MVTNTHSLIDVGLRADKRTRNRVSPNDAKLLECLSLRLDRFGSCVIGHAELAREMQCDVSTVRRSIVRCEAKGMVTVRHGKGKECRYYVHPEHRACKPAKPSFPLRQSRAPEQRRYVMKVDKTMFRKLVDKVTGDKSDGPSETRVTINGIDVTERFRSMSEIKAVPRPQRYIPQPGPPRKPFRIESPAPERMSTPDGAIGPNGDWKAAYEARSTAKAADEFRARIRSELDAQGS